MISDKRKLYNQQYQAEYKERVKRVKITLSLSEYAEIEKRAKAEGVKPTAQAKKAEMLALLSQGMSKPQIAKTVGVSVASVYVVLKEWEQTDMR